jgi:hypothetical protein
MLKNRDRRCISVKPRSEKTTNEDASSVATEWDFSSKAAFALDVKRDPVALIDAKRGCCFL